jgi:hypothetical protein
MDVDQLGSGSSSSVQSASMKPLVMEGRTAEDPPEHCGTLRPSSRKDGEWLGSRT